MIYKKKINLIRKLLHALENDLKIILATYDRANIFF